MPGNSHCNRRSKTGIDLILPDGAILFEDFASLGYYRNPALLNFKPLKVKVKPHHNPWRLLLLLLLLLSPANSNLLPSFHDTLIMLTCSQSPYPLSSLFKHNPTLPNLCLAKTTITATISKDTGLLFRQKLTYLTNLKINTQKALTLNPNIRSTPLSTLLSIENCLSSMGFHRSSIGRILDMHPCLLTSDPHLHLHPTFDFLLNEVEIPFLDISRSINRCPRLLVSSVSDQLRPALVFLKELGFVGPRKLNYQTTLLLVYNVERSLMGKIEFLMGLGFEFVEVKNMVVRAPGILTLSVERNMKPKFEYFVREMKGDPGELKKFPQFFSFSLERKIKPRHRMLVEYGLKMPLSSMLKVNDGEFNARLFEMRLRMTISYSTYVALVKTVKMVEGGACAYDSMGTSIALQVTDKAAQLS
ncbi:transcription termination factor MTEF1 [Populus alba x Populus x berolinensis]|uniref:Transcription termination factor MTEF1 n=1 Tax=Populus alba x Populus x berolinensis TaxID=444605 RepID=A0AAD6Q816_9ROSI|nr:transcription termination factor MTEF1 [Populus alba x Populus x berolinensis]